MKYLGDVSKHLKCFQASARCSELGTLPAALFRHPVLTAAPPGSHSSLPPPQSPATDTLPTPPSWPKTQVFLSQPRVCPQSPHPRGTFGKSKRPALGQTLGTQHPDTSPGSELTPGVLGGSPYIWPPSPKGHTMAWEKCVCQAWWNAVPGRAPGKSGSQVSIPEVTPTSW